jgi:hypothetical protein
MSPDASTASVGALPATFAFLVDAVELGAGDRWSVLPSGLADGHRDRLSGGHHRRA